MIILIVHGRTKLSQDIADNCDELTKIVGDSQCIDSCHTMSDVLDVLRPGVLSSTSLPSSRKHQLFAGTHEDVVG